MSENIFILNKHPNKSINILFLHGYGQNKEMMLPLASRAQAYANTLTIDLPGSKNNPLDHVFTIDDYIKYLEEFLIAKQFKPDIIVGHSFGGKLASFYALKHHVTLLLLAPSSIKPKFSLKKKIKIFLYKIFKKLHKYHIIKKIPKRLLGSKDFQNTQGIERHSFVNIVNSYLDKNSLKSIKNDVFLVWGNQDQDISLYQMKKMNKYLSNGHLVVINGDHFAYIVNAIVINDLLYEMTKELIC